MFYTTLSNIKIADFRHFCKRKSTIKQTLVCFIVCAHISALFLFGFLPNRGCQGEDNKQMLNLIGLAINILASDGTHYVNAIVPDGGYIIYGDETLYYEEDSINECKEITLPAGRYRIEVMGGRGGGDTDLTKRVLTPSKEFYTFSIDADTQIYLFRGGDGVVKQPSARGIPPGSGSSGVDSFAIIDGKIIRSNGGHGMYGNKLNGWYFTESVGGTGGANEYIKNHYGEDMNFGRNGIHGNKGTATSYYKIISFAGGGGGAPDGTAGTKNFDINTSQFEFCEAEGSNCSARSTAGGPATDTGGGNGGDVYVTYKDWSVAAHGGKGGKNVYYPCGGINAVSYGGGGSGAGCKGGYLNDTEPVCYDGTDGGSGSSNSSDTSYIKIYKYK